MFLLTVLEVVVFTHDLPGASVPTYYIVLARGLVVMQRLGAAGVVIAERRHLATNQRLRDSRISSQSPNHR